MFVIYIYFNTMHLHKFAKIILVIIKIERFRKEIVFPLYLYIYMIYVYIYISINSMMRARLISSLFLHERGRLLSQYILRQISFRYFFDRKLHLR